MEVLEGKADAGGRGGRPTALSQRTISEEHDEACKARSPFWLGALRSHGASGRLLPACLPLCLWSRIQPMIGDAPLPGWPAGWWAAGPQGRCCTEVETAAPLQCTYATPGHQPAVLKCCRCCHSGTCLPPPPSAATLELAFCPPTLLPPLWSLPFDATALEFAFFLLPPLPLLWSSPSG